MLDVACYCTQSRRIARALTDSYDQALAPSGLKVTQFSLLRIEAGRIRPVIDKVFPFEQASEALEYLALGRAKGKVVVRIA